MQQMSNMCSSFEANEPFELMKLFRANNIAFLLLVTVCYGAMIVVSNITVADACYVTGDVAAVVVLQQ